MGVLEAFSRGQEGWRDDFSLEKKSRMVAPLCFARSGFLKKPGWEKVDGGARARRGTHVLADEVVHLVVGVHGARVGDRAAWGRWPERVRGSEEWFHSNLF